MKEIRIHKFGLKIQKKSQLRDKSHQYGFENQSQNLKISYQKIKSQNEDIKSSYKKVNGQKNNDVGSFPLAQKF